MPTSEFQFLGAPHITAMVLTILVPIALATLVRKTGGASPLTYTVCYALGGILLLNEFVHWGYRLATVPFNEILEKYLSLHVCGIAVFAISFGLFFRHQTLYETAYFWGLVGTVNAVLTPQLEVGYPHYRFFQYFIAHGGIVIGVLFATFGLRMRPTLKSLFRSFLFLNVYMVITAGVNLVLKSNYMFICAPPDTTSPFFFAPWPWYIFFLEGIALLFFFVVYLPFFITDWKKLASTRTGHQKAVEQVPKVH